MVGDVLVEVRGRVVEDTADVRSALSGATKGAEVSVKLIRDRKPLTVRAVLTEDPAPGFEAMRPPSWLRELFEKSFRDRDRFWLDDWFEMPDHPGSTDGDNDGKTQAPKQPAA
jgi:hypothetical protein